MKLMKVADSICFLVYCASIGVAAYACSREKHASVSVKPPFENVRISARSYDVDPVKGGQIKMANGTCISVPANAFVDKEGKLVKQKVTLQYREFHNAAEIMASGIPMNYDSAGEHLNFQSAGMFEINGESGGQPVTVAQGKSLTVSMASSESGSQYNFFRYDPDKHNWDLTGTAAPEANRQKKQELATVGETTVKPLMPSEIDRNATVLDLDVDYRLYPELQVFDDVLWEYAGTSGSDNPKNFAKALRHNEWDNVKLTSRDADKQVYRLELSSNGRKYTMYVKPVLQGKDLKQARVKFDKSMNDYKVALDVYQNEQARLSQEADLLRTFSVSSFGIYNWDCAMHDPQVVQAPATFHFDQPVSKGVTVYLIKGEERKIVTYYPGTWNDFSFNPHTRNCLVAVMPHDRLAVFSSEDFSKIQSWNKGEPIEFSLKTIDKRVSGIDDLDALLKHI
jgi:hypothetical protein